MEVDRPFWKVFLNPLLKSMNLCIVSLLDTDTNKIIGYELRNWPSRDKVYGKYKRINNS